MTLKVAEKYNKQPKRHWNWIVTNEYILNVVHMYGYWLNDAVCEYVLNKKNLSVIRRRVKMHDIMKYFLLVFPNIFS